MHSFPDCLCAPLLDIDNFRLALKTHLFAVQRPRSALEALRNVLYKSTTTTSTTSVELGFDGVFFVLQNLRVKVEFPQKYFQVLFSSKNGTYHVVNTVHKGFTTLYGELKAIVLRVSPYYLYQV